MKRWRLSKWFAFEAAHSLTHLPDGHKCRRPHGHSYRVELVLESAELDTRNFAGVDYGDLDPFKRYLDDNFDHRDLNVVMGGGKRTTAEELARHFHDYAKTRWPSLVAVRVYETATTCVEYGE